MIDLRVAGRHGGHPLAEDGERSGMGAAGAAVRSTGGFAMGVKLETANAMNCAT